MSGNNGRRRGAHPQHRRGEETRVQGTRTGGRDAPNGGRNAWMCGARTAAETCGQGGHTNSTEAERSEGDCELAPCAVWLKGSVDGIGIAASATSVSRSSRQREWPRVQSSMGEEERVRRSPTWGRPSTLIGDCGSTPQRETKTAITCARWRWFECSPRLKIFQRSTKMFHCMSKNFTLNTSPIVMSM